MLTLAEIALLVKTGRKIFGDDPAKAEKVKTKLLAACHPDHNPGDPQAVPLFQQIQALWEEYLNPPPPITSPKRQYDIYSMLAGGDVADLHLAASKDSNYLLKISRVPGGHELLINEAKNLGKILTKVNDLHYHRYFPTLVESFPAKDKIQKHINVFMVEDGYYNLEQVHAKHPELDGRHIAWIFKRLLTALGAVHQSGLVHGSIVPSHIMVYPGMADQKDDKAHALMLVGFGQSAEIGQKVSHASLKYKGWCAPEILAKQPVSAATDIYMAARCMVYLSGGDPLAGKCGPGLEPKLAKFFKSLLLDGQKMRPDSAWDLYEEFSDLLKNLYGPPKFAELRM